MDGERRAEWNRKARGHLHRIGEMMDLDAPDVIMGQAIALFYVAALGYLGAPAMRYLADTIVAKARQSMGLCGHSDCAGELENFESFPPLCPKCRAEGEDDSEAPTEPDLGLDDEDPSPDLIEGEG